MCRVDGVAGAMARGRRRNRLTESFHGGVEMFPGPGPFEENAVATRLDHELDLDLATIWPYLWLTVPDAARLEITNARETIDRATTLAGWGLLYVVVAAVWWPGLLIVIAVVATAHHRGRAATDTYALLLEATVRLHTVALAHGLGLTHTGPLSRETGRALTSLLGSRSPATA
ncbi:MULTISPECIES: hypothetical protein [unclassified Pseudofrankia]|uniref:hypothetical protein n=1 Tax=unclassified Pseudofrankia TaxID=2994372 RepID=UPI0008D9E6A5|nr:MULTISPECIES: hypothetical protein [unclassified Pseudofrankia]MDT3444355.1 hypothetical protein [Pseudofrankia sp. BMG5.37]OHV55341.1 hypothetical protein BCD48_08650 [Pseudofrankia sp. BMG5.36]